MHTVGAEKLAQLRGGFQSQKLAAVWMFGIISVWTPETWKCVQLPLF
jgi:hypothetical protein